MIKKLCLAYLLIQFSATLFSQDIRKSMMESQKVINGLSEYLNKIPDGYEPYFGFNNRDDMENATFGRPYQIYCLRPDSIKNNLLSMYETNLWYIPIIFDNSYRCFLRVRELINDFEVVGIGNSEVAIDIFEYEKERPSTKGNNDALLIDEGKNILIIVSNDRKFSPIRTLKKCPSCESKMMNEYSESTIISLINN